MTFTALVALAAIAGAPDCSPACKQRVIRKIEAREMAGYHRHPMPHCTWWGESGPGLPEWSPRRYRALNPATAAGGKFQMLPSTFRAVGGRGAPHLARPVVQERLARRVLRLQGLGAWVLC